MTEITNPCPGCAGRDEINKSLAERVDELERENERLKAGRTIPTIEEMSGLVPNMTDGLSLKEYMERLSDE